MTRVDRLCLISLLATTGLFNQLSVAHAQSAEAEVLFRDGRNLIKRGKTAEGCDKLAASERIESSIGTLLNLGDCREKLGKLASAWAAFRKAEAMAKRSGGDDKRQSEAGKRASQLEPKLSNLAIEVRTPRNGMVIKRDGEVIDDAMWNTALPLDPGSYSITAEAPGFQPWSQTVAVSAGAKRQVIVIPGLERAPAPPAITSAPIAEPAAEPSPQSAAVWPPPPAQPVVTETTTWSGLRKLSLGVAVVGAGALGTGVYFGMRARDLEDQANERCPLVVCGDREALTLNEDARTAATRANLFYIAGGAALATSVVLWFVGAPGDTMIRPTASDRHVGLAMTGSF